MGRLLLVSNRLPVTVSFDDGELAVADSAGGLASGLGPLHARGESLWVGWPGRTWTIPAERRTELDERLATMRLSPVHLSEDDVRRYYEGFCNGVLWPLFHYLLDHMPLDCADCPSCCCPCCVPWSACCWPPVERDCACSLSVRKPGGAMSGAAGVFAFAT